MHVYPLVPNPGVVIAVDGPGVEDVLLTVTGAPTVLWSGLSEREENMAAFEEAKQLISRASYHRAADRGMEYAKAEPLLDKVAKIAIHQPWGIQEIRDLVEGQLVSERDIWIRMEKMENE
jgi:hypothetical protein